jgi:predicted NUDIX family phosphoesterase
MVHENVRLGIGGHLNALEGHVPSQRSKSALEHAPETGLEERMVVSFMALAS